MQSASGSFVDVPAEIVQHSFSALLNNTEQLMIWYTVFVLAVVLILNRGIRRGLERALLILMPCFLGLLIWLCFFASEVGDFQRAREFMLTYDLAAIDAELVVSALTQALFSLSIGMGAMIIYGAYLGEGRPLARSAMMVVVCDTAVALTMGLLIFSIVFAFEMRPDTGTGLIFETLPVAFSQMKQNSVLVSTAFFSLLGVAALTSAFALLEPIIAWMVRRFEFSRRFAAWLVGGLAWLAGLPSIFAFNQAQYSFYYFGHEFVNGSFDLLNILTTHLLMPFTALLITIFVGWRIGRRQSQGVLSLSIETGYRLWRLCTKIVAPVIILLVLLLVLFSPA
jgi:NSS family neurotransmitter:Na+ symporter